MVLVGVYLVYYGFYAVDRSNAASSNPIGVMEDWSSRASSLLESGGVRLGLLFAALVAVGAVWAERRQRRT